MKNNLYTPDRNTQEPEIRTGRKMTDDLHGKELTDYYDDIDAFIEETIANTPWFQEQKTAAK